ncbi:MAG: alpha/beta fold hydrolase [Bdellovibrionales bacterium]
MNKKIISISDGQRCVHTTPTRGLPQLFCIHGGMGLGSDSIFGIESLSEHFDLIWIDLRGSGQSDISKNGSYSLNDFAEDINEIVSQLKNDKPKGIFGHSLGGMVAVKTLAKYPSLFDFAILSNTAMDDKWRSSSQEAVQKIKNPQLDNALAKYQKNPKSYEAVQELAIQYGPIYFPELSPQDAKSQMEKFSYRAETMEYTSNKVYPGMDLKNDSGTIQVPTLILSGELDEVVPSKCQKTLADTIPISTLVTLRGCGHFPFVTKKDDFKNAISQWWKSVKSQTEEKK